MTHTSQGDLLSHPSPVSGGVRRPRVVWRGIRRAAAIGWVGTLVLGLVGCDGGREPFRDLVLLEPPVGPGSGMPHLEAMGNTVLMSWLEPTRPGDDVFRLRVAELLAGEWTAPRTYAAGDDFFVNWADFPSALKVATGETVAHWLERGGRARYDYDVRVTSDLPGGSRSLAWSPHDDGTPTEHGFVSMVADESGAFGMVWLDGRKYQEAQDGNGVEEMALRFREGRPEGPTTPETVLDGRTCDCCQTDAALTDEGVVVVYRDRSPDEIRDISITRRGAGGAWSEPQAVHADGWEIASCPVNGPAVAARGSHLAVAWFTAAQAEPRVHVAFSDDGGRTFAAPARVDEGRPVGRVDVVLHESGDALVSWIEETGEGDGDLRVRRVTPSGDMGSRGDRRAHQRGACRRLPPDGAGRPASGARMEGSRRGPRAGGCRLSAPMRARPGIGAALVCAVVLACGEAMSEIPTVGEPMAGFHLASVEGDSVALSDFAGRVVLVNLWATWCPPCRTETPLLQEMHTELGDRGFDVIGITVDTRAARPAVDGFLSDLDVEYTQLLDPDMGTMDRYGVIGLPATYLVGRDGTVRAVRLGPIVHGDTELEAEIERALAEEAAAAP